MRQPSLQKCVSRQAIAKSEETGIVTVNMAKCVGCMLCLWACPFGAPKMSLKGKMEKCTFCEDRPVDMKRACEEICPTQAIVSGPIEQLARIARGNVAEGMLYENSSGVILGHEEA